MTSKRARQIAAGSPKMTNAEDKSPVTLAVDEIFEGSVYEVDSEAEESANNVEE